MSYRNPTKHFNTGSAPININYKENIECGTVQTYIELPKHNFGWLIYIYTQYNSKLHANLKRHDHKYLENE